ncbi:MAG TPA: alpha-glucan family phosphorylase [Candidatus Dormibacteraeota bacterium]|nr:alpha-glucan family phosphorylase [Candidatus Dormibacteraeota bacterium]
MTAYDDLWALALNLSWTWDRAPRSVFERLDPGLWEKTGHNPVEMLRRLGREEVERRLTQEGMPAMLARAQTVLPGAEGWGADLGGGVAYFSMEFGFTDSLPIYSGGLGVLAADHLKAASQLGLPVIGVGLLYGTSFARQAIDKDGEQVSSFPVTDRAFLPIQLLQRHGSPVQVTAPHGSDEVIIQVWKAQVGSVPLLLLDTDLKDNAPARRTITDRLYPADPERRLSQEIVLGIGGVRALRAAGYDPMLFHLNEGHSFLANLELVREAVANGLPVSSAREHVRERCIFTTHTPVAAGSDYFEQYLVVDLLGPLLGEAGVSIEEYMDSGRKHPGDRGERLCTTYVALRSSAKSVAVSRLHGSVSRRLWKDAWPGVAEYGVPIDSVTNGVHLPTWVSGEISDLLREHVDERWWDLDPDDRRWHGVDLIPDRVLWEAHSRLRRTLVHRATAVRGDQRLFDPNKLTIGFSRRFAAYKRANLLLSDKDRLVQLLGRPGLEVQLVFSGKAHPNDGHGKEILSEIVRFAETEPRMSFITDYNLDVARVLVQGADVWLNNPRRLLEASGTSGMKAGANGALNLSVSDGWWDEGRRSDSGWTIESVVTHDNPDADDAAEAEALYRLLESRVVPLFYDRDPDGLPSGWLAMMRASIRHTASRFSARRMVLDYRANCYLPAARRVLERGDLLLFGAGVSGAGPFSTPPPSKD